MPCEGLPLREVRPVESMPLSHRQRPASRWNHWENKIVCSTRETIVRHNYLKSYLGQLLSDWGEWVDRAAEHTGFPTESSIVSANEAISTHDCLSWQLPGGGSYRYALPNRHAILCYDMPQRLVPIHQAILTLNVEDKAIITHWYAYGTHLVPEKRKPGDPPREGKPMIWDRRDKAAFIGISYDAFERRVSRARAKIAKMFGKRIALASEKVVQIATMD